MTARANWRDDAAYRDADPELFFPIGTAGPALRRTGEAKRICRTYPAQAQCLAWALDNGVTYGVGEAPRKTSGAPSGPTPEQCQPARKTTMAKVISQQSTQTREYVRRLLKGKQPGISAARELAMDLVGRVWPLRRIVEAILYVNRAGCAWRYLPCDFPP
jgi:WhiB family redox-sensing transcriptional regulator